MYSHRDKASSPPAIGSIFSQHWTILPCWFTIFYFYQDILVFNIIPDSFRTDKWASW